MFRFIILLGWAGLVIIAGGAAITAGLAGSVFVGGAEVVLILAGIATAVSTPAWSRSVGRSRERAGL